MAIEITLDNPTGSVSHQVKIDENTPIKQLLPAIVEALGLPSTMPFPLQLPVDYHLEHNGCRLQKMQTLADLNIKTGDTLVISFEFTIKITSIHSDYQS